MRWLVEIILDVICRRGGACGLVAEVLLLRQQLLVLTRGKTKCPALSTTDRIRMALCTLVMTPKRIGKSAIAVAESTLLNFHHALIARKYKRLFSNRTKSRPGPKGPSRDLIKLVVEMKEKNPGYGCPKIAILITNVTGQAIDDETVRSILKRHYRPIPGKGPSWLLPIGNSPNKLWSVDLFRVESVFLKSYWVMVASFWRESARN